MLEEPQQQKRDRSLSVCIWTMGQEPVKLVQPEKGIESSLFRHNKVQRLCHLHQVYS